MAVALRPVWFNALHPSPPKTLRLATFTRARGVRTCTAMFVKLPIGNCRSGIGGAKLDKSKGYLSYLQALAIVFASACLPGASGVVHAQSKLDELKIIGSENIEGQSQTGDVVESEHTGTRSRIPGTRLEAAGAELGELLNTVSGVQEKQSGGFGSYSSITVRGASAAQSSVFLDGILLNSSGDPVVDLSTLEILNLESVDVYRGSAPLQLGHASMGGAVNLNTASSQTSPGSKIRLGVGSYSQVSLSASHQMRKAQWDWLGAASHTQSKNDFPFMNDNRTPLNPNDDVEQRRKNNKVRRSSVLLKGGYQASDEARTDALLQIAERHIGVPTKINNESDGASLETLKLQLHLSQIIDQWHGWNTRHSLYWHQSDSLYDDADNTSGYGDQVIDTDTSIIGAKSYWERFVDAGTLGLSIDVRKESLDLQDAINANDNLEAERTLFVGTAHLAFVNADDTLLITPALRWQQGALSSRSTSTEDRNNLPEKTESELDVQLGINVNLTAEWVLSANAGTYFRQPSFGELFSSTGLFQGNRTLKPEEGINLDVGLTFRNEHLHLEAAVFQSWHDNLIVITYNDEGVGRAVNTGEADITGLELSASYKPSALWQISANATIQDPRNRDKQASYKDRLLAGEAKRTTFTRLQYQPSRVAYWYELKTLHTMFHDRPNILAASDRSLHGIGIDYTRKPWKLSVRIDNVGDENVEDFNNFDKPGRTFNLALTRNL